MTAVPGLEVVARREGDAIHVTARGELDIATAALLAEELERACAAGPTDIVLDFGGLTFCDSSGLRSVILTAELCDDAGRRLQVVNAQPLVRRVFEVTGVDDLLGFPPSSAPAQD